MVWCQWSLCPLPPELITNDHSLTCTLSICLLPSLPMAIYNQRQKIILFCFYKSEVGVTEPTACTWYSTMIPVEVSFLVPVEVNSFLFTSSVYPHKIALSYLGTCKWAGPFRGILVSAGKWSSSAFIPPHPNTQTLISQSAYHTSLLPEAYHTSQERNNMSTKLQNRQLGETFIGDLPQAF